ncbi:hemerythrin domain-containing protein [Frondihabitans australicus]|uniref:Hemerythrin HHE cation binding domain-containing protein n=1 Tax=Frondihabitans australicus TaxID=386892 RepID=A0A495IBP7_9MICO|nr:hemerythrin domain-containing protein [Frondihabitans australicus]RKR73423.1 hemerythrin HHE cation binding domain-containing protein [Frondihabitans australicus]
MVEQTRADDNDVRGWMLVHDQIRGEIRDQSAQLLALRRDDTQAAWALAKWWASFSASLVHHMQSEDHRIWPQLRTLAPEAASALAELEADHSAVLRTLAAVDERTRDLPSLVHAADFDAQRSALVRQLDELGRIVGEHLEREESLVAPLFATRLSPAAWARLEQDMVKGLGAREMADLLPRMLSYAEPSTRYMMLTRRIPAPVRLLNRAVFEPRWRRARAKLPLGS